MLEKKKHENGPRIHGGRQDNLPARSAALSNGSDRVTFEPCLACDLFDVDIEESGEDGCVGVADGFEGFTALDWAGVACVFNFLNTACEDGGGEGSSESEDEGELEHGGLVLGW